MGALALLVRPYRRSPLEGSTEPGSVQTTRHLALMLDSIHPLSKYTWSVFTGNVIFTVILQENCFII